MVKLLVFAGSTRKDSVNKKAARACTSILKDLGVETTFVDLKDFEMPLYDGDLEAEKGLPENTKKFKQLMREHHGFVIVSPEYNAGMSGVLKNLIDWASRKEQPEEPMLECFNGKTAAILAATPGGQGGIRGLYHLRHVLTGIRVHVLPNQLGIGNAYSLFDEKGDLTDEDTKEKIKGYMQQLVEFTKKISS